MVEVRNVSKRYGNKNVVDQVSVTVPKGTITSFIGPNGAGKSTLLSMISRLTDSDEGEILIDGQAVSLTKSEELARKISILKQTNDVNIRLTVKELVSFGRFPYSKGRLNSEDRKMVEQSMAYMGLEDMKDKHIDLLSGGQRQRAFIAMILAQDTEYILLDEPLNNLDMKHSVQIMKTLRGLVDDLGKTILVVLHDINFASCYSDYIVGMKDGRLLKQGTADEMIDSQVLKDLYDMDIPIQQIGDHKICVYFT
ncbi:MULTISPECIES: iron ABC transporter ATP-binding protein [Paenibacillus]|jgi:iron complex transport system ATP-binding protein|uniref:ABC transporter ATP-binding protein n=2 Tax=Paenibacillus TaxID=44249 RepID=A0A1C3CSA7_PAEPO|nr:MULTISPECIES: ABC transporter ATP-binding protein [Paenibacillus]AOK89900.1 iron ABC transporter ATP-binding protein [Paenibacillus polymyxa]MCP3746936.1 ABC transporter ATP-binding protein [Paenibacillus sp. A3M_27_13]MDR6780074.1 iron complex transport system ATP-binding protein [Paenibacillus peoriae]ODA11628.1 iron ABC transporter ATP-binding protein [Paenibacillus polymyxa]OME68648.1 iron ABC transporter ATP-binding protein [Paenibacillus peoriae]